MITDDKLTEMLRDVRDATDGLDPELVTAGAFRRRSRRRFTAAAGGACAAVAAVALGATTLTGGGPAATDPGVAGGPSSTSPTGTPSASGHRAPTTAQPGERPTAPGETKGSTRLGEHPSHRGPYVGELGAKPLGTIPVKGKVAIAPGYWFETRGTRWCITSTTDSPEPYEPFGCRGTVGNANLGDGTSPGIQSSGLGADRIVVSSVFKGDVRRVVYADGKRVYEAKVYRLAGVPGWVMSTTVFQPSSPLSKPVLDLAVFAYNAAGELIASFPETKASHPLASQR